MWPINTSKPKRRFQHTAARRRLQSTACIKTKAPKFQHTAARRRLHPAGIKVYQTKEFQHTAARRRLPWYFQQVHQLQQGFNTQPRGGGCLLFL